MKTLFLSALFVVLTSATGLIAQSATLAPTASPIPATEPENKSTDAKSTDKMACCDMCKGDHDKAAPGDVAKHADDEKVLRKLEQAWCDATANHDAEFIAKVEVDDYLFTDSDGKVTGKTEELAQAKAGGDKIGYKLSDVTVRVYGDTAILNGITTFEKADPDAPEISYRWTDTFVRRPGGEWQVAASQATSVQAARSPEKQDE